MSVVLKPASKWPKFAARLTDACEKSAACPPLNKGRLSWLKKELSTRGVDVSVESIRKWLAGDMRARQNICEALADILSVDLTWLYMGKANLGNPDSNLSSVLNGTTVPIEIRPNVLVQITGLPFDLKQSEAARIANIVLAHAQPENGTLS